MLFSQGSPFIKFIFLHDDDDQNGETGDSNPKVHWLRSSCLSHKFYLFIHFSLLRYLTSPITHKGTIKLESPNSKDGQVFPISLQQFGVFLCQIPTDKKEKREKIKMKKKNLQLLTEPSEIYHFWSFTLSLSLSLSTLDRKYQSRQNW